MAVAYSWDLAKGEDRDAAVRRLLRTALERGAVDAVLVPVEGAGRKGIVNMFTTDPEDLGEAVPFAKAMAQFGPQDLVRLTEPGGRPVRIAAVLKPCEARAVVELAKLNQVELEEVVLISPDCEGTVELKEYAHVAEGVAVPVRLACNICRSRVAMDPVDLALGTLGVKDGTVMLVANGEKGKALAEALDAKATDLTKERRKAVTEALKDGDEAWDKQEAASREKYSDLSAFLTELSPCIKCMNCQNVCPVCYCAECLLETDAFNPTAGSLADKARRRGSLRMPVETVQFHLVRMAHVMTACVMCGQCESACPSDIPLVEMYAAINRRIQDLFDYRAGRDLEEAPPFTCFAETEGFSVGGE
jgi:formate dehydrogenase subunit beta